jgi:hypothetical protein
MNINVSLDYCSVYFLNEEFDSLTLMRYIRLDCEKQSIV